MTPRDTGTNLPPFEQVVTEHGPVVMRVVRALLGPADADDAWSEAFLAALDAYPRLRPGSNVRGWLVTIAHRKAIDQLRGHHRRPLPATDVPERAAIEDVDNLATIERDPALWGALEALPFKQRAAVAYHHLAGLPFAEVGALLGNGEAAARRAAADGIANLRKTYPEGART